MQALSVDGRITTKYIPKRLRFKGCGLNLVQDRDQWSALLNMVMGFRVKKMLEIYLLAEHV